MRCVRHGLAALLLGLQHGHANPQFAQAARQLVRWAVGEGMTEYRFGEHVGYGLSEYLDQVN